jgi:hypothetical protein
MGGSSGSGTRARGKDHRAIARNARHHEVTEAELADARHDRLFGVEVALERVEAARKVLANVEPFRDAKLWRGTIEKADRCFDRAAGELERVVRARGATTVEEAMALERADRHAEHVRQAEAKIVGTMPAVST